jgi:3-dehydroquinate synthase/shikimate kinase/3-dehydroquinate synthase
VINEIVYECIKLKSAVVSEDEFDMKGLRKMLNFGHTFAHAFESYFNFRVNHGKAVSAGIVAALLLSYRKRIIDEKKLNFLLSLPLMLKNKRLISEFDNNAIIELMKTDKKNKKGKINFVLIQDVGKIFVNVEANKRDISYALDKTEEMLV